MRQGEKEKKKVHTHTHTHTHTQGYADHGIVITQTTDGSGLGAAFIAGLAAQSAQE